MKNVKSLSGLSTLLLLFVLFGYTFSLAMADSGGAGSFTLVVRGYTVTGELQNAVLNPDGTISMKMALDGSVPSPIGAVPITANGVWTGVRNGSILSGTIGNVAGSVNPCFLFWCGAANFVGQGQWSGSLVSNSTVGSGEFQGTITFTSSDISGVPVGQPEAISGSWNADFS